MKPQTPSNHVGQTRKGPDSGRSADSGYRPGFRAHSRTAVNWHVVIGWGIGPAVWLVIALVIFFCCSSCEKMKREIRQEFKATRQPNQLGNPRPVKFVYRNQLDLFLYTYDDSMIKVELEHNVYEYTFEHKGKTYAFKIVEEPLGSCEEYIEYNGGVAGINADGYVPFGTITQLIEDRKFENWLRTRKQEIDKLKKQLETLKNKQI